MQRINVVTYFDCTQTGTTSYRKTKVAGAISTVEEWDFSRNQQRNFETILQCVSLRANPDDITVPTIITNEEGMKHWTFSLCISHDGAFATETDETGLLKEAIHGVPMIVGLKETYKEGFLVPYLIATGAKPNIYFEVIQEGI
jgi:hypothetical protein